MAQNITIQGASYSDVPAVELPKTGGGTAQFDDTTDADATASDIAQGKTAYVNGVKLIGTGSGGEVEFKQVIKMSFNEDITSYTFTTDTNGDPLSFDEAYIGITTARASSSSNNGQFGITLRNTWVNSFNGQCLYNNTLYSDVYTYWFHIKKAGPIAVLELIGKLRTAGNMSSAFYPSDMTWSGTKSIGVNNSASQAGWAKTITDLLDSNNKIHAFTIGVDTATAVKISAGTMVEVFAR